MDQTFELFSECSLFRNFERWEKEALFTRVKIRDFAAGETICVIGSPGDSGMIVLQAQSKSACQVGRTWPYFPVGYSEKSPC
jgi:CRP-like cAMP-binding protein